MSYTSHKSFRVFRSWLALAMTSWLFVGAAWAGKAIRPTATTLAASSIITNAATAKGSANPNGQATTAYFQWGTTTSYGHSTASQSIGSGNTAVSLSTSLTGLLPSTT